MAFVIFTVVIAGMAFGATYIYSNPAVQSQLGLTQFVNNLPWKHDELVAKAREAQKQRLEAAAAPAGQ